MYNSNVVELLKSFSAWELNHLEDFLDSPFHNKNKRVRRLFRHLRAAIEAGDRSQLDKEACFDAVYAQEEFDKQKLYNISSLLFRNINAYASFRRYQHEKGDQLLHLLTEHITRKNWSAYEKTAKQLQNLGFRGEDKEFYSYRAGILRIRKDLETQRLSNEAFYTTIDHLDRFYLFARLRMACEYLNRGNVITHEQNNVSDIEPLLGLLHKPSSASEEGSSLQLYSNIYRMLTSPDQPDFFQKCISLLRTDEFLGLEDKRDGASYCINYCIRQLNLGKLEYQRQLFELYIWTIEEEILFEAGELAEWHFKNIVSITIRENQLDYAEEFVQKYSGFLPEAVRENASQFNRASIYFARKAFSKAKKLLIKVQFLDIFYSLDSKVLLAKIYFEEGEFEALNNLLKTFNTFLSRDNILSENQRSIYKNFIWLVTKLVEIAELVRLVPISQMKAKNAELKAGLEKRRNTAQYAWVHEKVESLGVADS